MSNHASTKAQGSNPYRIYTVCGVAVAMALIPATGLSQERQATLEEVLVTAQKREQSLQDVPSTVNVLTGNALRSSSITEVNQISNAVPGIFINSDQTGRNTKIKIRGVGPDEASNIRPAIGFFYNDIPLMNQLQGGQSVASDLDLGDLARLEVLKGPQSTLFGESVSGGAMAFYNRRPQVGDGWNGRLSTSYGSHGLRQYRGALGGDLGEYFAFRVSAFDNTIDDQVKNTVDGSRRELSSSGFSAQLAYMPSDALNFILEYNRRESIQDGGTVDGMDIISYGEQSIAEAARRGIVLTPADPFDRKAQMLFPLKEKMKNELISLHIDYRLNDRWSITSVSAHQMNQDRYGGDGLLGGYNASNGLTEGFYAQGRQEIDYTTTEFRVTRTVDDLVSMFGFFLSNYDAPESRGDFGFVFPGFVYPLAQYIQVEKDTWSLFTHNSWTIGPQWELVAGARYTREEADGRNGLVDFQGIYSGQPLDVGLFPKGSSDEGAWGGTAKVLFNLNDNVVFYGGVDRGFRLGGINNLGEPNYDTEVALNFETGFKSYLLDRTLRFFGSLYYTDYDGYQVASYNSEAFTFITQNADVIGKGIEVEVHWLLTPSFEVGFNALYNRVEYDRHKGAICDNYQLAFGTCPNNPVPGAQDLSGYDLPSSPEFSGNLTAQYTQAWPNTGLEWFIRAEHAYRGSAYAHPVGIGGDPEQQIDSYGLFNASLGISSDLGWSVRIWGKNLTNEDYFTDIGRQPVGSEPTYIQARIGWERSYGMTLDYNF